MARRDEVKRIEDMERRGAQQEREMIVLAETIKELATELQHLARSQVEIIESHNELIQKVADLEQRLDPGSDHA